MTASTPASMPASMPAAGTGATAEGSRRVSVEQVLAIASAVLLPLGLAMVLLGWYGASHTPYLFEQIPYLISGGLLGVGLAVVGAVIYFGSWTARSAAEQRRHSEEVAGLLREVRDELRLGAARQPAPAPQQPRTRSKSNGNGAGAGNGAAAPYVATARGSMLHRSDCAVVAGRDDLRPVGGTGDGLAPCALCDPLSADLLTS
jgi:hypothetical protein